MTVLENVVRIDLKTLSGLRTLRKRGFSPDPLREDVYSMVWYIVWYIVWFIVWWYGKKYGI